MSNEPRPRGPVPDAPPATWLGAVEELLDATVDRSEVVECEFDDLTVDVPLRMSTDAPRARWRLNGTVRVSVDGTRGPLAEWVRWWRSRME